MAKRSKVAQEAFDIAFPVAQQMGFDLVDAEYKKEGQDMFLRLFIDKKGGVGIDDCENFSKAIDPIFDEKLNADPDYFEVSSPGLTRPLTEMTDFVRYAGEKIDVKLFKALEDGSKSFTGVSKPSEDGVLIFEKEDGTLVEVALENISKAVRHIDF